MRNRFVSVFIVVVAVFVSTPLLHAQTTHDVSGIWRMLAPGATRARAASVGAGASHPTLGNDRPALTAWGQMQWSQTRSSGRNSKLSFGS